MIVAAAAAAYALLIDWSGGFELTLGPARLRSRDAQRPAILAAAAFIAFLIIDHRRARGGIARAWSALDSSPASTVLFAAALIWTMTAGVLFNTWAAGGADSYGYVSQAELLRAGKLVDSVPFDPAFTWRDAASTLVPLGFVPTAAQGVIAPLYPPGLPLLLVPATLLGETAVFLVVPAFGAVLVAGIWTAGRRMDDPLAAGIAALLVSTSPTFLYQVVQPMSDVPAAALWVGATLAATRERGAVISGTLAGAAILVRPNLAPLAAVVLIAGRHVARWDLRRATGCVAPIVGCLALLLYIQHVRYGSPTASGYGSLAALFRAEHVGVNLRQYPAWVTAAHTPLIWLFVLAPLAARPPMRRTTLVWLLLAAAVWALYIPYVAFKPDEWHYTRFLLPALAVMLLLTAIVILRGVRLLLPEARMVLTAALFIAWIFVQVRYAERQGAFLIHEGEAKYPAAGAAVLAHSGPNAWVLAGQHSGSLRKYAQAQTVRWDMVQPSDIDRVVEILSRRGSRPIAVLDPGEADAFRSRFRGSRAVAAMIPLAVAEETRIYGFQ